MGKLLKGGNYSRKYGMQNFKSNSLSINDFKYSEAIPDGLLGTYSEAATTASTQGLRDYGGSSSHRGVRRSKKFSTKGNLQTKSPLHNRSSQQTPSTLLCFLNQRILSYSALQSHLNVEQGSCREIRLSHCKYLFEI